MRLMMHLLQSPFFIAYFLMELLHSGMPILKAARAIKYEVRGELRKLTVIIKNTNPMAQREGKKQSNAKRRSNKPKEGAIPET